MKAVCYSCVDCRNTIQFRDGFVPREFYCTSCGRRYLADKDDILSAIKASRKLELEKYGNK